MLSSKNIGAIISGDLDQNAYTTWHSSPKILDAINQACHFIRAYAKWPRNLVVGHIESQTAIKIFSFNTNIFYPYWVYLDETEKELTNVPIIEFRDNSSGKVFVQENVVKTTDAAKKIDILYHSGHKMLTSLGDNDIDMPFELSQAIVHVALWMIYPGGMDLGASLANQNFNMAKTLLDTYAKAYGPAVQPKNAQPSPLYRS